jgi:hypothetical protein
MDFRVMASKAAPDDNRVSEEAEDLPNNCASETESNSKLLQLLLLPLVLLFVCV